MDLYFASGNKGKILETQEILGFPIKIAEIELDEIQDLSSEVIIRHKLLQAFEKLQKPVFVDDVSTEIKAWNGFPGPFMKYLIKSGGNELLLKMLKNEENRGAVAIATIGYHDGHEIHIFEGSEEGTIATEIRGTRGWGWDPIFIPKGKTKTFAEMSLIEKNEVSHRRRALQKFKDYLEK